MPVPNRPTQADLAHEKLRSDILSCRLRPGARIRINDVAQELQVSLGAVREALSRLAAEDMAVATAQKGFSVPEVSADDLGDLTETRIKIEEFCLREAITKGDIEWETGLVGAFHRLQHLPERDPLDPARLSEAWAEAHQQFHAALVAACTSAWMLKIRAMLYDQSERYRRLSLPLRKIERDVASEHRGIFDAAMSRDADLAVGRMRRHLSLTTEILMEFASLR